MNRRSQRPVFLNLWQIRLPVTGVTSILHRLDGVLLTLLEPLLIGLLSLSATAEGYARLGGWLDSLWLRLVVLALTWVLAHHACAGVRFLLLDLGLGLDKPQARRSAWAVHAAALSLTLYAAVRLLG